MSRETPRRFRGFISAATGEPAPQGDARRPRRSDQVAVQSGTGVPHHSPEEFVMPIHDWTRVRSNRFHDFHQSWTIAIRNALNAGRLPPGYFAMVEQKTR